jgi:hypothetical protein
LLAALGVKPGTRTELEDDAFELLASSLELLCERLEKLSLELLDAARLLPELTAAPPLVLPPLPQATRLLAEKTINIRRRNIMGV